MTNVRLPSSRTIPKLGLGTWYMGENSATRKQEVNALRYGFDYGARLVDCAEMYGEGEAEKIVGEAMQGFRDQLYVVSKFYPHNAGRKKVIQACEHSLRRLNTDHLDLYLLHWQGSVPFEETLAALYQLQDEGKILDYGVSNLDIEEFRQFCDCDSRKLCATNQVLYNLHQREAEWALKPYCDQHKIAMMAYCPLDQGALIREPVLQVLAQQYQATPAQIALAWLLHQPGVIAIPKSIHLDRVKDNLDAANLVLSDEDLQLLDEAFPAPANARSGRLSMR